MHDDALRQLVRAAIARHLGDAPGPVGDSPAARVAPPPAIEPAGHASHVRFHVARLDGDTMCVIEPAVACNHCGHCECLGH